MTPNAPITKQRQTIHQSNNNNPTNSKTNCHLKRNLNPLMNGGNHYHYSVISIHISLFNLYYPLSLLHNESFPPFYPFIIKSHYHSQSSITITLSLQMNTQQFWSLSNEYEWVVKQMNKLRGRKIELGSDLLSQPITIIVPISQTSLFSIWVLKWVWILSFHWFVNE